MTTATILSQPPALKKNLGMGITPAVLILAAIMFLSLGLHLYNIQSIGDSNAYYTAAVESMLQSPRNFFFVAAEPGGSVTVDKPPLGLWIEAVFAYFLGVSGFSTSLPNILAGVFGLAILYALVKKYAGELAGLIAAFVMTVTPVYLATNRNNTMDGLLVFFLLLAAWAFVHAIETEKNHWVLIGAIIIGLGFNIKMSQALLPLPAFYALYFLGSKEGWLNKAINLGVATIVLTAVSLSWAIAVDFVPENSRPFIGSSRSNSVIGLILEHNGGSRLVSGGRIQNAPRDGSSPGQNQPPQNSPHPNGAPTRQVNTPFNNETGQPGVFRFFTSPLSKQMSWLLPFALISIVIAFFSSKIKLPIESGIHKALILWGGWLLTCVVFFSMVSGIFHSYYAIMLVPPLGAMIGIGFALLWSWSADRNWVSGILIGSTILTLAFQVFAIYQYEERSLWMFGAAILFGLGIMLVGFQRRAAYILILSAMLVMPVYWTVMTVSSSADQNLPTAYTGSSANQSPRAQNKPGDSNIDQKILDELQANTQGIKYLVAVPTSQMGAPLVLATGRPVLYMGGFYGQDDIAGANDLEEMVANGELRYILYGSGGGNKQEITNWLRTSCVNMIDFAQANNRAQPNAKDRNQIFLYRCE